MKKILFILLLFITISCTKNTYKEDPSLKESERIALLEKAKYDTTSIVIELDDKMYIMKDSKIIREVPKTHESFLFPFVIFFALFIIVLTVLIHTQD